MFAFRVAYDGHGYHGFQRQPNVPTVEGCIFDALDELDVADGGPPSGYTAAGRTDAGVSAIAQTIAFEAPPWLTPRAMNSALPGGIRAWSRASVPPDFHATVDPHSRTYVYHLYAPPDIDDAVVGDVLDRFVGTHDFHNLTSDTGDTTRTVYSATKTRRGPFLEIAVRADGFRRHLVRRMVALAELVATNERSFDLVDRILSAEAVDGSSGVPPAPPEPLVLTDVRYPAVQFEVDDRAVDRARSVFRDRYVSRRSSARVAERIASELGRH